MYSQNDCYVFGMADDHPELGVGCWLLSSIHAEVYSLSSTSEHELFVGLGEGCITCPGCREAVEVGEIQLEAVMGMNRQYHI